MDEYNHLLHVTRFSSVSLETSISVEMTNNASNVLEGESLRFGCSVRSGFGPQSHLSVTWQLVDKQNRRSDVVRLDRDGTLQPGPSYSERSSYGGIQMEQVRPGSFTLEIFNSVKADEGHYECRVTEWTRTQDGEWQMIGERHASTPVSITALGEYQRHCGDCAMLSSTSPSWGFDYCKSGGGLRHCWLALCGYRAKR